jgi:peptidoglycan/LPS O-acetylase OafA/YrhL
VKYNPALDGLRALAVLAVVAVHAKVPGFSGGFVGVDLFFVLSGYLITQVLAENPDLRRFYWHRARRLIPPLALMLAAYLAIFPLLRPEGRHWSDAGLAFFYLSDYAYAFWRMPEYLNHTWSLSVEEHFYLLWPLVFLSFRPSIKQLAVAYVLATLWRWQHPVWIEAYVRFDMRLSGLILGCLIAQIPRDRFPAWPGLLALAVAVVVMPSGTNIAQGPGIMLVELAAAVAILGRPPEWLPKLAYPGKLSYGIYLWHYPIARVLREWGWSWQATFAVTLLLSVALAALSYHTIEVWVRRPVKRPSALAAT